LDKKLNQESDFFVVSLKKRSIRNILIFYLGKNIIKLLEKKLVINTVADVMRKYSDFIPFPQLI
jgi:hypothetical protein